VKNSVRIGGASAFWGDSSLGALQLVEKGDVDYLVFDYLAELTMSIMAAQRMKNPEAGYAADFVAVTMRAVLRDVVAQNIRVVSNAGGVNPQACARALQALAKEQGVSIKVAVIEGDDVLATLDGLDEVRAMDGTVVHALPDKLLTANAYLGALPVKAALDAGAQVVITGRCVDSAVTLGALMHAFQWSVDDYDKLAQGSLAGHIIECGCQATGGLFTDWQTVPDWANMGYPVLECFPDARFVVNKPPNTGGLISTAVVAEQLLYEIGDPSNYLLPDVNCDFTQVHLRQLGDHRVEVSGAIGRPPTSTYKVSSTYLDGFKSQMTMVLIGFDAVAKARRTGEALIERLQAMFAKAGYENFSATNIEIVGSETVYGDHSRALSAREVVLRLVVRHRQKAALDLFTKEIAAPGTSFGPGTTGMEGGRPHVAPLVKQHSFLVDKALCVATMRLDEALTEVPVPVTGRDRLVKGLDAPLNLSSGLLATYFDGSSAALRNAADSLEDGFLLDIAHGRSGDKGDISNIGVIARRPEYLAWILAQVTPESVKAFLSHRVKGEVSRYLLPGIGAINLVCTEALDGGGMASMRFDNLGKGMAQILLSMPIKVPSNGKF
jgi:Acyclic terpene utilisation family protein AtuA